MSEHGNRAEPTAGPGGRLSRGRTFGEWDRQFVDEVEFTRVRLYCVMAACCEAVPRRLGRDVPDWALALDKRIARQVNNLYVTRWKSETWISTLSAGLPGIAMSEFRAPEAPYNKSKAVRRKLATDAWPGARSYGASIRWSQWFPRVIGALPHRREMIVNFAERQPVLAGWGRLRAAQLATEIKELERILKSMNDYMGFSNQ